MDRDTHHRPTEESQQLPPTEDEQRNSEEYFSFESFSSSNDGPAGSSQESPESASRTQLHPQSGLAVRTSTRVLYYRPIDTPPEITSHGTTLGPNQDISLPREGLHSRTEEVEESEIPSQDVGATALERDIPHEPLKHGIATGEEARGPDNEALNPPGPSRRLGDNLQEFISKYSAEFHTIISDFSNFVKIVQLFTDHPNVLLGIVQIFIDNPELVRFASEHAELNLPLPDQLPLNRRGSSSGPSGFVVGPDRNPETAGGSTVPDPPQALSGDLGPPEEDLGTHINLLTKLDELKKILLHLQDRNDQGEINVKSGPGGRILVGDSHAASKKSDQFEMEPPSREGGGSNEELPPGEDSVAGEESQPSELGFSAREAGKSSELQAPVPTAEGVIKWTFKPTDGTSSDVNSDSSISQHSASKDSKSEERIRKVKRQPQGHRHLDPNQPEHNRGVSAPQRSGESDIESPSRKAEDSSKEPQPVAEGKPLDHRKQEGRSTLPAEPDENVGQLYADRYSTKDSVTRQKSHESELPPQEVGKSSGEQPLEAGRGVIKWVFRPIDSGNSDVPSDSSSSENSARRDKRIPQDPCGLDYGQTELSRRLSGSRKHAAALQTSDESEIGSPSRKVGDFGNEPRPGSNAPAEEAPRRSTDRLSSTDSASARKSQQSESSLPSQEVGESSKEHQLDPNGGVIKWSLKPTGSRSSDVSTGPFSPDLPPRKDGKSLGDSQGDEKESQFSSCPELDEPDFRRRPSGHGIQSSEDRSSLSAAPEVNVEQRCEDRSSTGESAAEQKLRQSESEFLLQEVGNPASLPCQFTDLVTEQAVRWFFKFSDTTISVVGSNSSCSEGPVSKDVESAKDTHKQKSKVQGPCDFASNQPGPSGRRFGHRKPASLESTDESEIDSPKRKVGESSKEPQPGPSRSPSKHPEKISEGRSGLPKAPDADRFSTEDFADRQKSHQAGLGFSSEEVGGSSEEQQPGASEGHPSSPTTDLLTDEVVKWFFDLNNSIRLLVESDLYPETTAPKDIKSSAPTHKRNEEPQDSCRLALDQSGSSRSLSENRKDASTQETSGESELELPSRKLRGSSDEPRAGPSRRSSEHRERISEGRSGLPKAPHDNIEHRQADYSSAKDSAARQKSQKSKSKCASKEEGESSGEQLPGSKKGQFLAPSADLSKGKVSKDSDRRVGKDFKSTATGEDPPTPEEKSSPQWLNVGNVNELMGHLNPPPIPTTPCEVCHLRPMKFEELNFWYELHWKLIIDGGERQFESQAKPIILVNPMEADEYFQEIKSRTPNPDEDSDKAHQKPTKYKKGKKDKKRNF